MRWTDLIEYPRARRVLRDPIAFLRTRRSTTPGTVHEVELRGGGRLRLRGGTRDFHVFHRVFIRDEYGLDGLQLSGSDRVVDGGAHVGIFTLRAALTGARVLSIEPARDNLSLLRRNVQMNDLLRRVIICPAALGAEAGEGVLSTDGDPYSWRLAATPTGGGGELVTVVTLESLVQEHAMDEITLLKLDCEGAEYRILEETSPDLLRRCVRIRLECHEPGSATGGAGPPGMRSAAARLRDHLADSGFAIERFEVKRHGRQGYLFCRR